MEETQIKKYKLQANTELRIESEPDNTILIKVEEGNAEIFGSELQLGKNVNVSGKSVAVYTWSGCSLTVTGSPTIIYEASETPMASYLNVHEVLERRRLACRAAGGSARGPRVLLAGPTDSGKSTISKMLINWAVRAGWEPAYVDLDLGQNGITLPGCVAAVAVDTPVDIESGFRSDLPLVYFYGNASPDDNPSYYKQCVESLANVLERRCAANPEAGAAGYVINTMGYIEKLGYELLRHAIVALQVDVVLVVNQDRLQAQLASDFGCRSGFKDEPPPVPRPVLSASEETLPPLATPPTLVKLSKSGGVVERSSFVRRRTRENAVFRYFYGDRGELQPELHSTSDVQLAIFRICGRSKAPLAALPIGAKSVADPLSVQPVAPGSMDIVQSVLAVSHAATPDRIAKTSVAGFVLVKEVDSARGLVSYTVPAPMPLPGRYLILGSLRSNID